MAPSAHDAQDDAREAEYLPGEQYKQVPAPDPENKPAWQSVQDESPMLLNFPAEHKTQSVRPPFGI